MGRHPEITRRLDLASEAVILAVVVLSPWAFGAVEAWAGFLIAAAIVVLAVLEAISGCADSRVPLVVLDQCLAGPGAHWSSPTSATRFSREATTPVGTGRGGLALLGLALLALVQAAQDREAAIGAACWLVLAWVFFRGVVRLESGRRVAAAIAINSAALALFAMIQALTWNGKIYWLRESPQDHAWFAGGPFVCHNHLAAYLNLGLGFAIGFLVEPVRRERGMGLGWAYVAGVVAVGVIGSQSRGGTVAMLIALVTVFAVTGRWSVSRVLAAIVLASFGLAFAGGGAAITRLATVFDSAARGYTVRFEVWRAGLQAWLERPVLGSGLGSFATAAAPYFRRDHDVTFTHAESEPVQLLTEGGLVAFAIAGAGIVALATVARRALRASGDRSLVLGAIFGLSAVAIQSLGDFGLHIPAVALAAVAAAALLTRLARGTWRASWLPSRLVEFAAVGGAVLALAHSRSLARSESALAGSGVPLAGSAITAGDEPTKAELLRMATALERALIHRPNWSDGHLRLGETRMALYQAEVSEWIKPEDAAMADPLWLLGLVHEGKVQVADLTNQEPVVLYLISAARSFLEARRANPASASAYVGLAGLHYLLEGDEPAEVLLDRARRLAGADSTTLARVADIAVRLDDLDEAARCWQRILAVRDDRWEEVADAAGVVLSPETIRDAVATGGRDALRFADYLYAEDRQARDLLMTAALQRLPDEIDLSEAERLSLEAHVRAALDQHGEARKRMEQALALEPSHSEWREELIGWLLTRGEVGAARRHARVGMQLCPGREGFRKILDQTTEALARGHSTNPPPDAGGEAIGTTVRPRTP